MKKWYLKRERVSSERGARAHYIITFDDSIVHYRVIAVIEDGKVGDMNRLSVSSSASARRADRALIRALTARRVFVRDMEGALGAIHMALNDNNSTVILMTEEKK